MKGQIFLIGRDSSKVNIVVEHETISSVHAQIVLLNGGLIVVDVNSKNGVYVNEQKVLNSAIKPGDSIGFGKFRCSYADILNSVKRSQFEKGKTSLPVVLVVDESVKSLNKGNVGYKWPVPLLKS